jgi:N-dimethylarginine dimethylaminohydrolase
MATIYQTEVGRIVKMILKPASAAFVGDDVIDREWQALNYSDRPSYGQATDEYDQLVGFFTGRGIDVQLMPRADGTTLDSIYVRDTSVICKKGVILCNMGKKARRGEPEAMKKSCQFAGLPIVGAIEGDGMLEGGDVLWIDDRTLVVGQGYRTNSEGIDQLKGLVSDCADEVIVAQLPHWRGAADVFHLMSIFSPIDKDLALVYSPLMPVVLRQTLLSRGYRLIEVPEDEYDSMACNVLALAPNECLMISGNPKTRARLEEAGVLVYEMVGNEISVKGAGGPTCLTRPTLRESVP